MTPLIKFVVITGSFLAVGAIKFFYPDYKDDNVVEELVENVIENQTGFDLDLTPLSPEDNQDINK